eukprot:SAG31_NODE_182_length_21094_cov_4.426721_11_plen_404_part_00
MILYHLELSAFGRRLAMSFEMEAIKNPIQNSNSSENAASAPSAKYKDIVALHSELDNSKSSFVLNPDSSVMIFWRFVQICCLAYTMMELPYRWAFSFHTNADAYAEDNEYAIAIDRIVDALLLFELVLSFITARWVIDNITSQQLLVNDYGSIARAYVFGDNLEAINGQRSLPQLSFVCDLLSCLPIDTVIYYASGAQASLPFRCLRLLRMREMQNAAPYYFRSIKRMSITVPGISTASSFFILTMILVWCTHLAACCLHVVGLRKWDTHDCASTDTCGWIATAQPNWLEFTDCSHENTTCDVTPPLTRYAVSVYYAFTIISTVGFGDISAHRPEERVITVIIMLAGSYTFALVMGTVGNLVTEANESKYRFRTSLNEAMRYDDIVNYSDGAKYTLLLQIFCL